MLEFTFCVLMRFLALMSDRLGHSVLCLGKCGGIPQPRQSFPSPTSEHCRASHLLLRAEAIAPTQAEASQSCIMAAPSGSGNIRSTSTPA